MFRKVTWLITCIALVSLVVLLDGRDTLAQDTSITQSNVAVSLFWYEKASGVLLKGNADGSGTPVTCLTMPEDVRGIVVDSEGGKIYWLERSKNRLRRANLNCSGTELLSVDLSNPDRLALDTSAGRLYWTENNSTNRLQRSNLDGSNIVTVLSGLGLPVGVAVDSANGFLYWTEQDPPGVWRATLGGANKTKIIPLDANNVPLDITVDAARGRIYWINTTQDAIYTATLAGGNPTLWLNLLDPRYLLVDPNTGQVYWGDFGANEIHRANADTSNNQLLFSAADGVDQPRGLALYQTAAVTCYAVTRSHTGQGSDPTATPNKSTGCGAGQYVAGEAITLSASPAAGWRVAGWSGTNNDASTSTFNTVTMPEGNHAVSVSYEQVPVSCYTLTRTHSGSGNNPVAAPAFSTGCGTGQYVAGEAITLSASPAAGWRVAGWSGTNNDVSTSTLNTVTMPAANHNVSVIYDQQPILCYALTRTHSGSGNNPVAAPAFSTGCGTGQYVAGEAITLTASPAAGWRVAGWDGTNDDTSTSTTNTVVMPATAYTVSVVYEQVIIGCYTLSRGHAGQGSDPIATPTKSDGCNAGQYVAGQSINLTATPAAGWRVAGWQGTDNDSSVATSNHVTMPAANDAVTVTYVPRSTNNRAVIPFVLYSETHFLGPMEIEPNDSPALANGPLLLNHNYQGYPNDRDDYFYFELSTAQNITIALTNITGKDPQLHLRDAGNHLVGDIIARPPHVLIRPNLPPGRYYVRVVVVAENNNSVLYTLRVETR